MRNFETKSRFNVPIFNLLELFKKYFASFDINFPGFGFGQPQLCHHNFERHP